MGSQMFSPQENEPQEPEEMQANTDSREQQHEYETPQRDSSEYGSYEQGYQGIRCTRGGREAAPSAVDLLEAMDLDYYCCCRATCYRRVCS